MYLFQNVFIVEIFVFIFIHFPQFLNHDVYFSDLDVTLTFQVQPDLDELPVNMEDNEDAESTKSEVKLGKLQFSLDYDFQKGEVRKK